MMQGYLVLEDGTLFRGEKPGQINRAGEVVFNTSHQGYEEIATDPSYFNQIIVMTSTQQGNYGVSDSFWESRKLWIEGFVCLQIQNSLRDASWKNRLEQFAIPVLHDIDTRSLVHHLREHGTPWGALVSAKSDADARELAASLISEKKSIDLDWVHLSSRKQRETRKGQNANGPKVAVIDFGCKENILRELVCRSSEIEIFTARAPLTEVLASKCDYVMLTNGPGNPEDAVKSIELVRSLIGVKPIFGICMGHQILALALGAKTFKLKFGHRGANHPIQDALLNKIYMTSQNHGYAVMPDSLPPSVKVTHRNLNDNTVAGIFDEKRQCLGVQFHPESHPGPHEAAQLFDFFTEKVMNKNGKF